MLYNGISPREWPLFIWKGCTSGGTLLHVHLLCVILTIVNTRCVPTSLPKMVCLHSFALFSLCHWVGRKKGLVQFKSHIRLDSSVNQRNVMHFQIVVPASIDYHRTLYQIYEYQGLLYSLLSIESVINHWLIYRYTESVVNVAYYV